MYTLTPLGSAFCFQNCFWQKPKEKYEPDVQGNSFFIRMRRIALCLPTDLEPLHFTEVMLKIPLSDGLSFSSAGANGTQGEHPWGGAWPRRASATPRTASAPPRAASAPPRCPQVWREWWHIPVPAEIPQPWQCRQGWAGHLAGSCCCCVWVSPTPPKDPPCPGSILSQGLMALGAAQVPAFHEGSWNDRLGWEEQV